MNMSNDKKNRDRGQRDDTMGAQDNLQNAQPSAEAKEKEERDESETSYGRDES